MEPGSAELTRLDALVAGLTAAADPERAAAMARYMKDRVAFFGVPSPARRSIQRQAFGRWHPTESELIGFTDSAWARPERELQYAGCDLVIRSARTCSPGMLDALEQWITHRSWWDTVDALAHGVGDLVVVHPQLVGVMDSWIDADDFWLARVALIHQLRYRSATDADRLFAYCARRAADREFFIRKAIGWALREYSKTAPDAVASFVEAQADVLSGLSRREALRVINPR